MHTYPSKKSSQSGNAFVYILIAVILFGALSFMLSSGGDGGQSEELDYLKIQLRAEKMIKYATEVKSVLNRMEATGTHPDDLDFMLPSDGNFDTAPKYHKVYHSSGGGLYTKELDETIKNQTVASPPTGWYLGRFNNVEWTPTASEDVILTAYQIDSVICSEINKKILGTSTIPVVGSAIDARLVDNSFGGAANVDFEISNCAACEGKTMLCVENSAGDQWTFYSIVWPR